MQDFPWLSFADIQGLLPVTPLWTPGGRRHGIEDDGPQCRPGANGSRRVDVLFQRLLPTDGHHAALSGGRYGARNGVTAALLAREGITADPDLIEGHWGFCELFSPEGYDLEIMTRDLGSSYFIATPGVNMKKHSCCAAQHVTIDALVQLMADNDVHYDDVDSVAVHITNNTANLLRPDLPSSTSPRDGAESRFSVHHGHAVALAERGTPFRAFTDVGAKAARSREARQKIKVVPREDIKEGFVDITLKDGRCFSGGRNVLRGDTKGGPANPFTQDELVARHEESLPRRAVTEGNSTFSRFGIQPGKRAGYLGTDGPGHFRWHESLSVVSSWCRSGQGTRGEGVCDHKR